MILDLRNLFSSRRYSFWSFSSRDPGFFRFEANGRYEAGDTLFTRNVGRALWHPLGAWVGAYEFAPAIEVPMHFTPQALNPDSKGRWLKAHFVLPEGFVVEDVDANVPATLEPVGIESDYINVFADKGRFVEVGVEIGFDRAAICGAGIDYGPAEVTVMGRLNDCRYFYGTDTIRIITSNLKYLAAFASHWLEADCRPPDWCRGADVDHSSVVDFVDFALFDGCCIEVVKE